MIDPQTKAAQGSVLLARTDRATLLVKFIGRWHLKRDVPSAKVVEAELQSSLPVKHLSFDTSELTDWDSGLIAFLVQTSVSMPRARHQSGSRGIA